MQSDNEFESPKVVFLSRVTKPEGVFLLLNTQVRWGETERC